MAGSRRVVRQSVSLPPRLARQVRNLAKSRRISANRVLVGLIEQGISSRERARERFFALAEKLIRSKDAQEQQRLKEELAWMTFGH